MFAIVHDHNQEWWMAGGKTNELLCNKPSYNVLNVQLKRVFSKTHSVNILEKLSLKAQYFHAYSEYMYYATCPKLTHPPQTHTHLHLNTPMIPKPSDLHSNLINTPTNPPPLPLPYPETQNGYLKNLLVSQS